ncbi:cubilin-like [Malaya genurostris]|uniref:cubilin-like n=1 Tax=Malaya genurostris TaxID=325434 RepID=UPI0026F37EB1|nr:cubilin-like [Malaya genurostris]
MTTNERLFPLYTLGRIANVACIGTNGLSGICQIRGECADNGGLAIGRCNSYTAQAVCCIYIKRCGGSATQNVTYFQNSGYPSPYNGGGTCSITVVPPDSTICQLRIDFTTFSLSQPDATGACVVDNIQITGGNSPVPVICGENSGQHVYVSISGGSISIVVSMTSSTSFNRVWNIQISMISCTSQYQAPTGCLQYYMASSGEVASLNYGSGANPALNALGLIGTRQLAYSNYAICIQPAAGQCSITYSLPSTDPDAFTMTGDATAVVPALLGTGAVGDQGTACTTDYLIIPNPSGIANDRFCGLGLDSLTSGTQPFILYYITDADDAGDVANRGFRLEYSQNSCAISSGK